jgi:hypothetical protein
MAGGWLTTDEIITLVDEQIAHLGKAAFGDNKGHAQLYSGPSSKVLGLIINPPDRNHRRAKDQAAPHGTVILDNSPIGVFLENIEGVGLYKYCVANPLMPFGKETEEADRVMRHVSRKFVSSLWGKVSTAVCGAAKDRVFYTDEIPAFAETIPDLIAKLIKSDDIETINGIPAAKIRKLYNAADYDAAFRLICLGEIRMAGKRARDTRNVHDMQDYLERKEFYLVERSLTWNGNAKAERPIYRMSPEDRLMWKQRCMNEFVGAGLRHTITAISQPTGPHAPYIPMPAVKRAVSGAHPV